MFLTHPAASPVSATRYIRDSDRPLSVVAEMLGFSALSVLSRWFRGKFGCSMSVWRVSQP